MLTISKPLSSGQARAYHKEEFTNAQDNYYSEGARVHGEWHGRLAEKWGLEGEVAEEHFARLADGQHPLTGEQLVRLRTAHERANQRGEKVRTMEHRAGWDATFSAPKTVSLTALVGGDERVRQAHREAVTIALDELEPYVQARISSHGPAETTGQWAAAKFEHDSSRPVDGYAAPQLHTHVVFFNLTERENAETRSLQPRELYRSQQYATAVYRAELALRLKQLGYEIEQSANGAPQIRGYTQEYVEASSPRRRQIKEHLAEEGVRGPEAAEIAAHRTRDAKLDTSHEEMHERHQEMAAQYGNQPQRVIREAQENARGHEVEELSQEEKLKAIERALMYARDKNFEREAVNDHRNLMRDALKHAMGEASLEELQEYFDQRISAGGFIEVGRQPGEPGRLFTTEEMIRLERENIRLMRAGQNQASALVAFETRREIENEYPHLTASQRRAVEEVLSSRDQITALEGVAGAGKTTSLAATREVAEREGYRVEGFAPTSRAAHKLEEAGIRSSTLQRHLACGRQAHGGEKHLYVLDESSLASTRQMHEFLHRLEEHDRVLLVGDVRQHEAVEAGKPYQQLQEAGMRVAHLDEIVRQKDAALKQAVEQLSRGEVRQAIGNLESQGRVQEIEDRDERLKAMAETYCHEPQSTLVISPDNRSRQELNLLVHREMQERGHVQEKEHTVTVLEARQEMTGADRAWAAQYRLGDTVRYSKGSQQLGIGPGRYATVRDVNRGRNLVTVELENRELVTYDPRRLRGVAVYRETERHFAQGERVQFTAPSKDLRVANRELGTIEKIQERGELTIRTGSGRQLQFNIEDHPHLDYGYALTSHSSQGQTADRVLVHVDTELGKQLVNARMAYVAVSRGRYDVQIYTNDKSELAHDLSREIRKRTATGLDHEHEAAHKIGPASVRHDAGQEHSVAPQGHSQGGGQWQAIGE